MVIKFNNKKLIRLMNMGFTFQEAIDIFISIAEERLKKSKNN